MSYRSLVVLKRLKNGWAGTVLFTDVSIFEVLNNQLFTGDPHIVVPLVTSVQLLPNKEDCGQGKVQQSSQNASLALHNGTFLILEIIDVRICMFF